MTFSHQINSVFINPVWLSNYKLSVHDQVIIRRLSARSGLTTSRQYYIWLNRCLSQPGTVYHQPTQYERSYHYSRLGLSLLLQKVGKTSNVIQYHRYDIFHIWLFLSATLIINPGYMLGIMTRPAVNRQDTLNLLYAETDWIKHDYKSPTFIKPAWL